MYELVYGNIFDKKCDLVIIPCNNMGGITDTTESELTRNNISNPPVIDFAGDISFIKSKENFSNALTIGYAASVNIETGKSDTEYLHNICDKIKFYCRLNTLSLINIPLLGTGAGGLSVQDSFNILKSHFENEANLNLKIFVLSEDIYLQLNKNNPFIKNPRVFISYTGENPENKKWVKKLAYKLRENGVNARIDIFHLKPGYDLPQWMTNELIMADKVLLICDKFYAKKADSRNGGVGWETMIIQGDMMIHTQTDKYVCIVREKNFDDGIPIYAKTKFSLQWTKEEILEEDFRELLYYLFECDMEPELGEIPIFIKNRI